MTMRAVFLALLLATVGGCGGQSSDLDMSTFYGEWEVETERTLKRVGASQEFGGVNGSESAAALRDLMPKLRIRITAQELAFIREGEAASFAYAVESSNPTSVTAQVAQSHQDVSIVFALIEGQYMNYKSTASRRMDDLVWKRVD